MWCRLPFGVKIVLCAEKSLVVRGAGHERNAGRLIEGVVNAVAPKKVNTRREVPKLRRRLFSSR
jgi:hypothetical protein